MKIGEAKKGTGRKGAGRELEWFKPRSWRRGWAPEEGVLAGCAGGSGGGWGAEVPRAPWAEARTERAFTTAWPAPRHLLWASLVRGSWGNGVCLAEREGRLTYQAERFGGRRCRAQHRRPHRSSLPGTVQRNKSCGRVRSTW